MLLVTGCSVHKPATRPSATPNDVGQSASSAHAEEGISATEDLMREHGVLDRLLLLYEESRRRLTGQGSFDPSILNRTAGLVRSFIEQYHEKLEETQLFPRFEKARLRDDLVGVLRKQHEAGRRVTDFLIEQTSTASPVHNDALVDAIDSFVRMYRPHAAREDTVLFPALHGLVSPAELHELGEQFEEMEHQRFGKGGFEHVVFQVAELERALGIHDLAQFTP